MKENNYVVFFDGVCGLCNYIVDFLIKIDKRKILKYSSLQSEFSKRSLPKKKINDLDGLVFLCEGEIFENSKAVIRIMMVMGGGTKVIGSLFNILPSFFSEFLYKIVSKNRYSLWGKMDVCRVPTKEEKQLFIE